MEALVLVKLWRTILVAAVTVGLGLYIWFVEQPRIARESEPDRLVRFDPARVRTLKLQYPQEPTLALEKSDARWRMTEPVQAAGDDEAIRRLLDQIADVKTERRIAKGDAQALATYGLDGNGTQARISLSLEDGSALPDIMVGNTTPVGFQAFVRVDGQDDVVLVPLLLHTGIKKTALDLREKKLFTVEPAAAVRATLINDGVTIVLERAGEQWKITSPIDATADPEQVMMLVRSLGDLSASAFHDGPSIDRSALGLLNPKLSFEVEISDHPPVGFRLGAAAPESSPGFYLERIGDGQVVTVPAWVEPRFAQGVNKLRDKRVFHCEADQVASISFERRDGGGYVLRKSDDGAWSLDPVPDRPVQPQAADRLLAGIVTLAGTEIVAESTDSPERLGPYGLDAPAVQVEVTNKSGQPCGRVSAAQVEREESVSYYVKRSDSATVMSVPAYLFSRLDMRRDDLLERKKEDPDGNEKSPSPEAAERAPVAPAAP